MAKPRSAAHLAYGRALRELRAERALSQERLALNAGVDRTFVSGIERGERNPTLTTLLRLVGVLEIPLSDLALRAERMERGG